MTYRTSQHKYKNQFCLQKVRFPNTIVFDDILKNGSATDMIKFLLHENSVIDLNKVNNNGDPPLITCVKHGNLRCLKSLINLGADVHQTDNQGKYRSSRSQMFFKTGVLKHFANFTGTSVSLFTKVVGLKFAKF